MYKNVPGSHEPRTDFTGLEPMAGGSVAKPVQHGNAGSCRYSPEDKVLSF